MLQQSYFHVLIFRFNSEEDETIIHVYLFSVVDGIGYSLFWHIVHIYVEPFTHHSALISILNFNSLTQSSSKYLKNHEM